MHVPENYRHRFFLYLLIFLFSISSPAQVNSFQKLIDTTNAFYKADDLLNLGEVYIPEHTYAKGHPYFLTDDYTFASLTVNHTVFDKIKARYNVETDQLIIKAEVDSGALVNISTKEDRVSTFAINGHGFVNVSHQYPNAMVKGYCEKVSGRTFILFIKYKKEFINVYDFDTPQGAYSEMKSYKYFYKDGKFTTIKNKKTFLKLFQDKKRIRKYMRSTKIRFSKASPYQLNQLIQFCNGLPESN